MYIVLLGPPGAGKGTQAKLLAQRMGLAYIASGDLFRQHQEKGTPLGLQAKEYMEQGDLVPDEITTAMVKEELASLGQGPGCVLDGYPRNLAQARALDQVLAEQGKTLDRVLSLTVPEEELVRRLSGRLICRRCQASYHAEFSPPKMPGRCDICGGELYQRKDDSPEVVRQRIQVYAAQTQPLIRYYGDRGKLAEVAGVGDIEEVNRHLVEALRMKVHNEALRGEE